MTRVLHTADTHIGYRQYHSPARQADFLDAFRLVASDAVESGVDAVVHAGDLFHDRRPGLSDLLGTLEVLETLSDAGIPFLAVVGNHEAKRSAQWLDLFEVMGLATRLGDEPVVVGETAFYGLDFVPRAQREDLDYEFEPHDAESAALVSHGRFEPLVPDYGNVEWNVAEIIDAASVEFDAVLLGDEHVPTTQEVSDVWVTYPGSTERASAGEREERGYNLVEFDGDVRISRRGLETRPFVFVDLDLGEREGVERVHDRLREHDLDGAVVHVSLEGDGESVSPASIESFATDEGALVARVKDRRELAEETMDVDVSFADPDEAVRERLREIELSEAARDLDETIRSSSIADSNVAGEIERRVDELLSDPDAFELSADADGRRTGSGTDLESHTASDDESEQPLDPDPASETEATSAPDVTSTEGETSNPNVEGSSDGQSSMGEYL